MTGEVPKDVDRRDKFETQTTSPRNPCMLVKCFFLSLKLTVFAYEMIFFYQAFFDIHLEIRDSYLYLLAGYANKHFDCCLVKVIY